MEKLPHHSPDPTERNIEQLGELFPGVVTETQDEEGNIRRVVDFDQLRQELSPGLVEGPLERYGLEWPGKREALFAANSPIAKTLRPVREKSVDYDGTGNLFIEGDNLDALKLLQESYLGKVKLIYIDPPYNTGKDFIYRDNFVEHVSDHLVQSNQMDEDGGRLVANPDASGRFHSNWLSMMYPRLRLARTLMADDGLIFISIDEGEAATLKLLCDQVFGSRNFVEQVAWKNKYGSGALSRGFANVHEYILIYSRTPLSSIAAPLNDEQKATYRLKDGNYDTRGPFITQPLATKSKDPRPNLVYPIAWNGREILPDKQWIWSKERLEEAIARDEVVFSEKADGTVSVRMKQYLRDPDGVERLGKPVSLLIGPFNQQGTADLAELFSTKVFDFPKPVELIKYLASFVINDDPDKDFVFLDFFAGSGTSAQAIMELNESDGGSRRFIAIQMPEELPEDSAAAKSGFETIADISRERIRRAGERLNARHSSRSDLGFRTLRVDTTNFSDMVRLPDEASQETLLNDAVNTKPSRSSEDILFECMVGWGLELSLPIEIETVSGYEIMTVDGGALIACFEEQLSSDLVRKMAEKEPLRAVFRDTGFESDSDRINTEQIFKELSSTTEVKVI